MQRSAAAELPGGQCATPDQGCGLDCAGFLERGVSAILVDRFETSRRQANPHELLQFRHPDAVRVQIGTKNARHTFRNVLADAAFLLGHAAAVNEAAAHGP